MLTQDATSGTAERSVQSKSPLLSIPAEIRNKIYGYVLIPLGCFINLRGTEDAKIWKCTHPIHTALLRTSHQIHQEASTLVYREAGFRITWFDYKPSNVGEYFPSNVPFKLVQNLEIAFLISNVGPISHRGIHRFLKALIGQQCSFNRLTLIYNHTPSGDDDPLRLESPDGAELSRLICAVEVRRELEIVYFYGYFSTGTPYPWIKDHIKDIEDGKSWIATESYGCPESLQYDDVGPEWIMRYLLHPRETTLSKMQ